MINIFTDTKMMTAHDQSEETGSLDWMYPWAEKEYGVDQVWKILAEETGRKGGTADRLKQFIAGGELVRRLNWAHTEKLGTWMI